MTFLEKAKKKFVESDPVIKDVCEPCNSGPLSSLDGYGKSLYEKSLSKYLYGGSDQQIEFEFKPLVKWLLKIAFNSARVNNTDLEILADYAPLLVSEQALPPHLHVFVSSVAPSRESEQGDSCVAMHSKDNVVHFPSWFRIGVFRIKDFDSTSWAFRHIAINSYCFYLLIPKLNNEDALKEETQLLDVMRRDKHWGTLLNREGICTVAAPQVDSLTYSLSHVGAFPFSYNIVQHDVLKRVLDDEFGLVQYWIDRVDIEAGNETNFLSFLSDISSSREVSVGLRGRVEFCVHGYDDDPRELHEIPEVVAFLKKIDNSWSYWMLFQFPQGHWLRMLALCLAGGKRVSDGEVEFDKQQMEAVLNRWFVALNQLSHRFAISVAINKEASQNAIRAIFE